jgi:uncharacterized metal-binding protein YceD (DUF177 family)
MKLLCQDIVNRGPLNLEESLPAAVLDVPGRGSLVGSVHLNVHAEALGDEILVLIKADSRAALECARCLDRFERPLRASLELHVPVSNTELDAAEEARQSLVLALPMKPLCRPDCRGLCAHCGENLNTGACRCPAESKDKPFAVLKDLKLD